MRRIIHISGLLITLLVAITVTGMAQDKTVSFIHSLDDTPQVWDAMSNELMQDFDFSRFDVSYNTTQSISMSASSLEIESSSVVVTHGQGGLLAREFVRQNGTGSLDALIMVGSPNLGAPVVSNVQEGVFSDLITQWKSDLAEGPRLKYGVVDGDAFADEVLYAIGMTGDDTIDGLETELSQLLSSSPGVNDINPESGFLGSLNASPTVTMPQARYAIFGTEDFPGYVRIADSFVRKNLDNDPLESGITYDNYNIALAIYLDNYESFKQQAEDFLNDFQQCGGGFQCFFSLDAYNQYMAKAEAFKLGYNSLNVIQHLNYEVDLLGVEFDGVEIVEKSDALIPAGSQAPYFIGAIGDRMLEAMGANHLELTAHVSSKQRLIEVFLKPDVNIPEAPLPLEVSISGPISVTGPGNYTWTASALNNIGEIQYQWFVDWELNGVFSPLGTNSSQLLSISGDEGSFLLKIEISDDVGFATDFHHVSVISGGGDDCPPDIICVN